MRPARAAESVWARPVLNGPCRLAPMARRTTMPRRLPPFFNNILYLIMKKQSLFLILSLSFGVLFLNACKNEEEGDTTAPVLTLEEPATDEVVSGEVHIHGKVTDESLHEMEILVTKDADGSELFKETPEVHDETSYSFDEHFTPAVAAETPVTLVITVSDHSDHTTTKTVKFKVKP